VDRGQRQAQRADVVEVRQQGVQPGARGLAPPQPGAVDPLGARQGLAEWGDGVAPPVIEQQGGLEFVALALGAGAAESVALGGVAGVIEEGPVVRDQGEAGGIGQRLPRGQQQRGGQFRQGGARVGEEAISGLGVGEGLGGVGQGTDARGDAAERGGVFGDERPVAILETLFQVIYRWYILVLYAEPLV
jgi:hypothetical protein